MSSILPLINHGHEHFGENKVQEAILKWENIKQDFKNIKLWSPKYYNYDTDVIDCKIDTNQAQSLNEILKKDNDFLSFLKDRTTSCSGFVSFYTYDDVLNNKDNKLIMYVLEYVCNQFNNKEVLYNEIDFEIHLLKDKEVA